VEGDELVDEARLTRPIGPRHLKGHLLGRMNSILRNPGRGEKLVVGGQAQHEPFRLQAQTEERRDVYCKTVT
jgi:hypothetical protein